MRTVVVTGMGICSPLGNTLDAVSDSLRNGRSGASHAPDFAARGFACQIAALVRDLPEIQVDRTIGRAFGKGNLLKYAYYATHMAILDSGLNPEEVGRGGMIYGNGGPSTRDQVDAAITTLEKGKPRVNPMVVLPTMTSGPVAVLATAFGIKRMNYMIGAACATSAIAIGEATEKILLGKADVMVAGGTESADWELALGFDAMTALCRDSNDNPERGSRAFDATRSGFVMGEGAGTLVLEELDHALARGARIYAMVAGYGQSSDGKHLTSPDQDGAERSMKEALIGLHGLEPFRLQDVDYLNTHGTSTEAGDANELRAIAALADGKAPFFSSTKSLSGHSLGAAGAHEAIYSLLMMRDGFLAASANIEEPDPLVAELGLTDALLRETPTAHVHRVMSNSFGFGGVNATLLFEAY